jgi:hypothetical protein
VNRSFRKRLTHPERSVILPTTRKFEASNDQGCSSFNQEEIVMKNMSVKRALLVAAVVACGVAGSVDWSKGDGLSFSVDAAQARVGRPLTPVSVAGVARRTTRRAVVGGAVVGGAALACARVLVNGRYVCRH